jgi:hypothetical protein
MGVAAQLLIAPDTGGLTDEIENSEFRLEGPDCSKISNRDVQT